MSKIMVISIYLNKVLEVIEFNKIDKLDMEAPIVPEKLRFSFLESPPEEK